MRVETIGEATLYCGDCLEILPTLGKVDACITDPPYGIRFSFSTGGQSKTYTLDKKNTNHSTPIIGDDRPFNPSPFIRWPCILWGANYFASRLPEKGKWLAWNKLGDKEPWDSFSDVEFAWCSIPGAGRIFSHLWKGLCQAGQGVKRNHPMQKPVELMQWCLEFFPSAETILDPFMGVGTTGVACANLGRKFIGIEIEPKYFDIACKRIKAAYAQPLLFEPEKPTAVQGVLL